MKHTYKRSLLSIAIAALMLVSLCAAEFSPLNVSAVDGSNTNVQATTFVGGQLASGTGPAVCARGLNSLDVFVQGTDHALWYTHWDGTTWSTWKSLGGGLASSPGVTSQANGKIDVFVRGTDGALWYKEYSGSSWSSNWIGLGGQVASGTGPAACSWGAGRLDVCVQGTDGALYHKWYNGGWSGWEFLGGKLTSSPAAAAASGGNRIDVFVRGTDGALWWKSSIR